MACAQAQTVIAPSQITPQNLRPQGDIAVRAGESPFAVPDAPPAIPAGAEKLKLKAGRIVVEGEFEDLAAATAELTRPLERRRITVADIFKAAAEIERLYIRAGYVFARVTVPPQQIKNGQNVRLLVIDGFVESISATALPPAVRDIVTRRVSKVVDRRRLTMGELERALLLAGDVAGVTLRSTLARGGKPGGVQLVLDGAYQMVGGGLNIDNRNAPSVGRWQYAGFFTINSALHLGEQIYGTVITDDRLDRTISDDPRLRVLGGGIALPIGTDGLVVSPEYTLSQTHPTAAPGVVDTHSQLQRLALKATYPLIRNRQQSLNVSAVIEKTTQWSRYVTAGSYLSRDDYYVARGGIDGGVALASGATLSSDLTLSQGLGGQSSAIPYSRQGAGPEFTKLGFAMQISKPLPFERTTAVLKVAGQTTFNAPVFKSEQFSLDGPTLVSGATPGSLSVDRGLAMRGEVNRSFDVSALKAIVSPYVFVAYGVGSLEAPTALEKSEVRGFAFGGGFRGSFVLPKIDKSAKLGVEFARQSSYGLTIQRQSRVLVSVASTF